MSHEDTSERSVLAVEHGALLDCPPEWEKHRRGTNWAATITRLDPAQPGGIARDFWSKAKGDYYYLLPKDLRPGMAVEFAGDYTTGGGGREPSRSYVVIQSLTPEEMTLETYPSARDAFRATFAADTSTTSLVDTVRARLGNAAPTGQRWEVEEVPETSAGVHAELRLRLVDTDCTA